MATYTNNHGFTLLELIVVLAGLGILSSLAIPNYMKYLDYAKVDEAKALLNSAAADCPSNHCAPRRRGCISNYANSSEACVLIC